MVMRLVGMIRDWMLVSRDFVSMSKNGMIVLWNLHIRLVLVGSYRMVVLKNSVFVLDKGMIVLVVMSNEWMAMLGKSVRVLF